ncbi:MAG: hypothetical protein HN759_12850 [Akkermansiaceae bacterium]|jgi:hypothetical protein|nr:hypothetical protein [Akkermansiaceae bacterium]
MKLISHIFVLMAVVTFLSACGSVQTVTKEQVRSDWRGRTESFSVGKDENGNPVMKSDRRSSLEGKRSNIAGSRDFNGLDYTKKSYRKKRWFGNSLFGKKQYQDNTDASRFKREPWFVQKQASASGQKARADGKAFGVNPFSTASATEQSGRRIIRPADAETAARRRVFMQPDITHWKKQEGLTIKDTNKMLGR